MDASALMVLYFCQYEQSNSGWSRTNPSVITRAYYSTSQESQIWSRQGCRLIFVTNWLQSIDAMMAKRVQVSLPRIISDSQQGFVQGQRIDKTRMMIWITNDNMRARRFSWGTKQMCITFGLQEGPRYRGQVFYAWKFEAVWNWSPIHRSCLKVWR